MLNKILANLRFNPDYLSLLREYQRKQSKEKVVRGLGFFFMALAFVIQIIAYTPVGSQTNAAASNNDLLPGGVSSKQQIVNDCNSPKYYNSATVVYNYYGVTCADIASSSSAVVTLVATAYNGNLWSVGHLPYGILGETPVNIGNQTVYWRYLHGWDPPGYTSTYTALKVRAESGRTFFILFNCGNLVSIYFPPPYVPPTPVKPPPPKKPVPTPCQYNGAIPASSPACKPCPDAQDTTDVVACLVYSKVASNLTKHILDANNTTAGPGDVIQYTLRVENKGKATVKDFVVQENLSDVLEYANLTTPNGGKLSSKDILSWPAVNIATNQIITRVFRTTVKNPLPQIAVQKDNPQGYNNTMTDVYGNTINIHVKPNTVVSVVNQTGQQLPNTGPGLSIFIVFAVTTVAGYFYSRSRLLNKEAILAQAIVHRGE